MWPLIFYYYHVTTKTEAAVLVSAPANCFISHSSDSQPNVAQLFPVFYTNMLEWAALGFGKTMSLVMFFTESQRTTHSGLKDIHFLDNVATFPLDTSFSSLSVSLSVCDFMESCCWFLSSWSDTNWRLMLPAIKTFRFELLLGRRNKPQSFQR